MQLDKSSAMLPPHVDVNIPACLQARRGALLDAFEKSLKLQSYHTRREDKEEGNHLTPWLFYVRLSSRAPSKSEVQFGETEFADVNPVPHLWSRAKEDYRHAAHRLLRDFMQQMVAELRRGLPLLPPPPRRLVPRPIALADFYGHEYGPEYLNLAKGDVVLPARVPEGVDAEGWAYGSLDGKLGWYPESFVADA